MNKVVLHKAIDLLSRREHSAKELKNKLLLRELLPEDIDEVITFLIADNYLCETRYTESVYRSRISKGYGKRYIESELSQKGVIHSIVSNVAQELSINWYVQAEQVYRKKFGWSGIESQKDKAKRIRFLQHRGFSTDEILTVLNEDNDDN